MRRKRGKFCGSKFFLLFKNEKHVAVNVVFIVPFAENVDADRGKKAFFNFARLLGFFQREKGFVPDGLVGPVLWNAIVDAYLATFS